MTGYQWLGTECGPRFVIFQPLGREVATPAPVGRMSGIPDGVGAQNSQLAAHLRHMAHFLHLHDLAKVGEQALIFGVDEAPCSDLKRKI